MTGVAPAAPPTASIAHERADRLDRRHLLGGLALLALLYAATATWSTPYFVDAFTNAVQARTMAADGTVFVEGYDHVLGPPYEGQLTWLVPAGEGTTSQYPPGTAAWAAPFYLFDTSTEVTSVVFAEGPDPETIRIVVPSLAPAAVAAVVSVVIAMGFLAATIRRVMGDRATLVAVAGAALGTGAWSIAADMLWQHGPAMMCISAGVWAAATDRFRWSGLAFAAAILVRPHTALIAASLGLVMALRRRAWQPVVWIGLCSSLGLVALIAYNDAVFGSPSISGGYGGVFTDRLVSTGVGAFVGRAVGVFVDPDVGMLLYSPFLVLCILGAIRVRRTAPDWALGAFVGALAYLIVQIRANRISGGGGFFAYRYPLEALMAAGPYLAMAARDWVGSDENRRRILGAALAGSVAIHGLGAITTF